MTASVWAIEANNYPFYLRVIPRSIRVLSSEAQISYFAQLYFIAIY